MPPDHRAGALLTADEFFQLAPPETERWELLEGVVAVSPRPTLWHQELAARLFEALRALQRAGVGRVWMEVAVTLDDQNVLVPDLVFVRAERGDIVQPHAIVGAPDLVVEVLSPSTERRDQQEKSRIYARAGVPTLWIVDPDDDRVDVYRLRHRVYGKPTTLRPPGVLRHDDLPELEVDLGALFAR
jgi:Uma2 family endonuclease